MGYYKGKSNGNDPRVDQLLSQMAQSATKNEVALKADKTEVQAVASGSPKGVYDTVSALQSAFPTGNTNIYLVTGNVKEVASLTVASVPTTAGNVTVTLNGVSTNIAVDPAIETSTALVATKIRNTVFPNGAVMGGTGSIVTFTAASGGVKTDATYSAGTTGATGTMTTTTQGVDPDGKWYYWNGSTWASGGVYQSTSLPTATQNEINNVVDISDYLIGDKTSRNLKKEIIIQNSDWTLDNVTISNVSSELRLTSVTGLYGAIFKNIKKMRFKIGATVGNTPFVLLGIGTTYTAIGIHSGVQRRLLEVIKAGTSGQYTMLIDRNTGLYGAAVGDEVIVELSGTWVIVSVKKVGESIFTESFRLDLSIYTGATGWLTSPSLGFVRVTSTSGMDASVYEMNNLEILNVGDNLTEAIINLNSRTTTLEQNPQTTDLTAVNQRLDNNDQEIDGLQSQINALNPSTSQGRWFGKTWNVLGDSFTARNIYQGLVKDILGIGVVNSYGVSGSCISEKVGLDNTRAMSVRYSAMTNTTDIVTVWGGVNDYGNGSWGSQGGIPLGTNADTTTATFYGALRVLIEGLLTKYPTKKIAFITPIQMNQANALTYKNGQNANTAGFKLEQYVNVIKEMCEKYGIPCLDLYHSSGLNEYNMVQFTDDGLHPNTDGFTFMSHRIAKFIEQI
jgi:lysophospholipase L1-like esterase